MSRDSDKRMECGGGGGGGGGVRRIQEDKEELLPRLFSAYCGVVTFDSSRLPPRGGWRGA